MAPSSRVAANGPATPAGESRHWGVCPVPAGWPAARGRRGNRREAAKTLDFSQPVALVLLGILGQLPDSDRPGAIVDQLLEALPSGSYLALCDGTDTSPALNQAIRVYNENSASSYHLRSPEQEAITGIGLKP
jgi:S-adenosyl methyltransferase